MSLYQDWLDAKAIEKAAIETRREIEDQLIQQFRVPEAFEGTANHEAEGFKIKIVGRMNRKVDSDKVQEIAAEHGTSEHLASLFRWKPEINVSAWKNTAESITAPLLAGITTTPGRPTITITKE